MAVSSEVRLGRTLGLPRCPGSSAFALLLLNPPSDCARLPLRSFRGKLADDARGVPSSDHVGRDVAGDDTAGADNRPITDRDARANDSPSPAPDVGADGNRFRGFEP